MFKFDTSLFVYRRHSIIVYFLVYVDDVLLTRSHTSVLTQILNLLRTDFTFKDLGDLHYFLGL